MKIVLEADINKKQAVEKILKSDEIISRQSIITRIYDNKCYFLIDGSEEAIKKAKEITKDIAKICEKQEEIIKRIEEEENDAMYGFGNIFG
jgi:hypothetical protein